MDSKRRLLALGLGFGLTAAGSGLVNSFSQNNRQDFVESDLETKVIEEPINDPLLSGDYNVPIENQAVSLDDMNKITPNYHTDDFSKDNDKILLARMIFGEARGCSPEEMIAVAYTSINRANDGKNWNGNDIKSAILKPNQYSCFNENDPNREKLMDPMAYEPKEFLKALDIAERVISGGVEDPTNGATHYFTGSKPYWADKIDKIGRIETSEGLSKHEFYRED